MRRPFFKLKDASEDAMQIVKLADMVFHVDKKIKEDFCGDAARITQERVLQIGPILQSVKDKLDILEKELDPEKEPELVKAVKYALKEYPCLLNALQDGSLDFSNNRCERQIRRLAKGKTDCSFAVGKERRTPGFTTLSSRLVYRSVATSVTFSWTMSRHGTKAVGTLATSYVWLLLQHPIKIS